MLLANHGLAATGPTLLEAYNRAEIVEDSAQAYLHCKVLGRGAEPRLLQGCARLAQATAPQVRSP